MTDFSGCHLAVHGPAMRAAKQFQLTLAVMWVVFLHGVRAQSNDFSVNLSGCTKQGNTLSYCLGQTMEELRPLMHVGIPKLRLPPTEPMEIDSVTFSQGSPPVMVTATFSNVIVTGLSTFITNYIQADTTSQNLQWSLTVPKMDIQGFYNIQGEVFILPLVGSGTFTTRMLEVTADGASSISPVINTEGKKIFQVNSTQIDFNIGKVVIQMDNLFNGENRLLADTVNQETSIYVHKTTKGALNLINRLTCEAPQVSALHWYLKIRLQFVKNDVFLNEHGQEVLREVKPAISRQMSDLVTRVMNDALSELPVDDLLNTIQTRSQTPPVAQPVISGPIGPKPPVFFPAETESPRSRKVPGILSLLG